MKLIWEIETQKGQELTSLLQMAADQCPECEGITLPVAVHVLLCDDTRIQHYNREFRQIDRATDVLSFPLISYPEGKTAKDCPKRLKSAWDDEENAAMLGDLIISMDHVYAQAKAYGHTPEREAAYLLVHGICHLMGYDHMQEDEKVRMRAMEETILKKVGLERSDRVSDEDLLTLARDAMENSYSPYSGFPVGAAIRSKDGQAFTGCNIENASLGLTNCAERTAVFKAVSEGVREFDAIAIAARSAAWPCGACRQVLNEFAPDIRVMVTWDDVVEEANLQELLPHGFGPKDLETNH